MIIRALQDEQEGWAALQDELSNLSTNGSHCSLPTATHNSLMVHKADAAQSSRAIREVAAVRTSKLPVRD